MVLGEARIGPEVLDDAPLDLHPSAADTMKMTTLKSEIQMLEANLNEKMDTRKKLLSMNFRGQCAHALRFPNSCWMVRWWFGFQDSLNECML